MKYKIIEQEERYFCGNELQTEFMFGEKVDLSKAWQTMFHETYAKVKMKTSPYQMIGLNCYEMDDLNRVTYYALVETIDLIKQDDTLVTKKIPKGKYICFEASYPDIAKERKDIYQYCKEHQIKLHDGFDYEYFLNHVDYQKEDAVCELCIKLEHD